MNMMKMDNTLPCLEPQSQLEIDYRGNEAHGGCHQKYLWWGENIDNIFKFAPGIAT